MSDISQAAASGVLFEAAGKKVELRPLTARDLGALELQALHNYKRRYIKTYTDNLDLVSDPKIKESMAAKAMESAAKLDLDSMPAKELEIPSKDGVQVMKVPYAGWWMTCTLEGKFCTFWYSARKADPTLTYEQACELIELAGGTEVLSEAVDVIDGLGATPAGNLPASLPEAEAAAKIEAT